MPTSGYDLFCAALHRSERALAFWRLRGRPRGGRQRLGELYTAADAAMQQLQTAWQERSAALDAEPDPAVRLANHREIAAEMQRVGALIAEADRGALPQN